MVNYAVLSVSSIWSNKKLKLEVEKILHQKASEGYEIVFISFAFNTWWGAPTAYITICK